MAKYVGNFTDRLSVAAEFEEGTGNRWSQSDQFKPNADFPKASEILYAEYETADYKGNAFVLFKQNGKLYEVSGSHCSCYGLEGQWKPEETSWEALAIREPSNYGAPEYVVKMARRRVKQQKG
jgi:hypothetical protein